MKTLVIITLIIAGTCCLMAPWLNMMYSTHAIVVLLDSGKGTHADIDNGLTPWFRWVYVLIGVLIIAAAVRRIDKI